MLFVQSSPKLLFGFGLTVAIHAFEVIAQSQMNFPVTVNITSPITLAVQPLCGTLLSENFTEVNTGINLSPTRTIVAFGDSWTSNGANGTVPVPPIMWPPSPSAGSQFTENRRASNGFIWVEDMANELSAKLLNYAWGGAVIDNLAYNTTSPLNATGVPRTDFVAETSLFLQQGRFLDALIPDETLYTVSFGINDDGQFKIAGGNMTLAYETYVAKLGELQAQGATNILIQGMYKHTPEIDLLQNQIFAYLRESNTVNGTNVAFVNLERLFDTIASDPSAFGYRGNATCLISANTIVGGCDDPDHSVFWIPGHPSQNSHRLISEYTMAVLEQCTA
ncbi:MAG: hypothetical protein NXY57DRAFT_1015934 [Lentinula lateritia]|uniref:Carbohydrate esterase family 16 protein n=1 Tax=Lentinula lateritia TaxID=40482 RepID=A0ABQ8VRJ5_9AGAR|nr:MAG: hypothetical protein NXY57DRAFT_1015934 [Lentinula lateritia]KAJ4499003.1 hypothetical protein C8R41DRAFT_876785 [Lentinula lateritia]